MGKIGSQHGATAAANRWRDLDPGGTKLTKGADGKWPTISTLPDDLSAWGAYDKLERALQITFADHDAGEGEGGGEGGGEDVRPDTDLAPAQARIFLAQSPLECLQAPPWMVPVCTADYGYRSWYTPDAIRELRDYFGTVEAWADCRNPTSYLDVLAMVDALGLDGAWGQCETADEFDNAYRDGARRMVGNLSALRDDQRALIASGDVLVSSELYRNVQPWMVPDWMGCNAGVGGDCIACYESVTEGAAYTPVADYIANGYYVPHASSVYGVGLMPQDWIDLGG